MPLTRLLAPAVLAAVLVAAAPSFTPSTSNGLHASSMRYIGIVVTGIGGMDPYVIHAPDNPWDTLYPVFATDGDYSGPGVTYQWSIMWNSDGVWQPWSTDATASMSVNCAMGDNYFDVRLVLTTPSGSATGYSSHYITGGCV